MPGSLFANKGGKKGRVDKYSGDRAILPSIDLNMIAPRSVYLIQRFEDVLHLESITPQRIINYSLKSIFPGSEV